nr:MAG TPA: hypothetical protein [Caudoviricetes sp.]
MNITLDANGETTNYIGAKLLSIEEGRELFFRGRNEDNAVEISLNGERVEIQIKIKDRDDN